MNTKNQRLEVTNREEAFRMIRAVLESPFHMAFWRLPGASTCYALFDLSGGSVAQEIEELTESFILNPYAESHPPKPVILKGDVILTITADKVELRYHPTLSASQIDTFQQQLANPLKVRSSKPAAPQADITGFEQKVATAIQEIQKGHAQKIVLSRYEDHELPADFDPVNLFEKLSLSYPNAFCHLTQSDYGLWLGASPERLISIEDHRYFSTDALAGTQPLQADAPLTQVGWTQKEIEEQAMVSRYIIDCFKRIRLREFDEIGPKTVRAGNLAHLKTEYKVDLLETNSPGLGSTMLELLHPTSAVCGYPRDAANQFIYETEHYDRELYAGFLGPVGFDKSTKLYVNLRCMKVMDGTARLFAGAGITGDSVPEKELDETRYKLETLLSVLSK